MFKAGPPTSVRNSSRSRRVDLAQREMIRESLRLLVRPRMWVRSSDPHNRRPGLERLRYDGFNRGFALGTLLAEFLTAQIMTANPASPGDIA